MREGNGWLLWLNASEDERKQIKLGLKSFETTLEVSCCIFEKQKDL